MLGSAIIVFRESLEAALVIGIIAAATRSLHSRNFWIFGGITAGVFGSLIVASLTGKIAELAEGVGQEIFNAGILLCAALMLAWHNIWMARHGMQMAKDTQRLGHELASGRREMSALGLVICIAILREGSETALFLYGILAGGEQSATSVLAGGVIGLFLGSLAGYGLYAGFVRIPARLFFGATSGLILFLAAAMTSQAARFLVQANLLSSLADPLWDTTELLSNDSVTGRTLHALIGYEAMPSGIQVVVYVSTVVLILLGMRLFQIRQQPAAMQTSMKVAP